MAPRHYAIFGSGVEREKEGIPTPRRRPSPHDAVADPFGEREAEVPTTGIVIGRIVNEGEALFHIARLEPGAEAGGEALTTLIPDLEEARATETPAEPPLG
jgi:hypothetical protein